MKRFLQQWPILVAGLLLISGAGAATVISSNGRVLQPDEISGLQVWLKADAISASNGDPVTMWNDQSGNANDMTTSGSAPTYSTDVLNGKPVVTFTSTQSLQNTVSFGSNWTILYVTRLTGGTNARTLQANENNWLLGTWGEGVNRAYYDGDIKQYGDAADTQWHIYVGEGNGSEGYFYSNGVLVATSTSVFAPPAGGLGLNTGAFPLETSDMQVAELVAYDTALPDNDVRALESYLSAKYHIPISGMKSKVTVNVLSTQGLTQYWTLDTASISDTTVHNAISTGASGTTGGISAPANAAGKVGQGLSFNGSDYIDVPLSIVYPAITVSAWFKAETFDSDNQRLVSNSHTDSDNKGFQLMVNNGGTSGFFDVGNESGEGRAQWDGTPLVTGEWYHYVGTYDGTKVRAYINGVEVANADLSGNIAASDYDVTIGAAAYGGDYFSGTLDDVRIYDRALSAGEVATLYNAERKTTVNASQNGRITDGLIGEWSFDGPDMTWSGATSGVAHDTSESGYDGTLYNFSQKYSVVPGKLGQALHFNGTNSYVTTGYTIPAQNISTSFTWSTWAKFDADNPVDAVILGFRTGDNWIKLTPTKFEYVDGITNNIVSPPVGQWVNITIVKDGGDITYYLNGEQDTTSFDGRASSPGPFYMGSDPDSPADGFFKGSLDDVRVYDRALSATEVRALYLLGK